MGAFGVYTHMKATLSAMVAGVLFLMTLSRGNAGTNVTGVVVDAAGKPLVGVSCLLSGTPTRSGQRVIFSAIHEPVFTDKEGRFSIAITAGAEFLADLQFDEGNHAPVFLYSVGPEDSPLKVVMMDGKIFRGRIVDEKHEPIANAEIELQLGQPDLWYQKKGITDTNGVIQFRITKPPQKSPWMIQYAGKRFEIDYEKVDLNTQYTLQADVRISWEANITGQLLRTNTIGTLPPAGAAESLH